MNHGNRVVLHQLMVVFRFDIFEMETLVIVPHFCLRRFFQDHSTLHARYSRAVVVIVAADCGVYGAWLSLSLTRFTHIWYCVLLCLSLIHTWLIKWKCIDAPKKYTKNKNKKRNNIRYNFVRSFGISIWRFLWIFRMLLCQVNVALTPCHTLKVHRSIIMSLIKSSNVCAKAVLKLFGIESMCDKVICSWCVVRSIFAVRRTRQK